MVNKKVGVVIILVSILAVVVILGYYLLSSGVKGKITVPSVSDESWDFFYVNENNIAECVSVADCESKALGLGASQDDIDNIPLRCNNGLCEYKC